MLRIYRFVYTVEAAEFGNQLYCCFLAYSGNAGNVVRAVAHQCFEVDKVGRGSLVFFEERLRGHLLRLPCRCEQYGDIRRDELECIAVSRQQIYMHACRLAHARHGSEQIVSLVALKLAYIQTELAHQRFRDRQLCKQLRRHRLSVRLVFVKQLVTKGRSLQIIRHGGIQRGQLLELRQYYGHHAVQRAGVRTA